MYAWEYLIHLIYCTVNGTQPSEKPEEVSFSDVLSIGKAHEVANIAFLSVEKLENKPDEKVFNEWRNSYYLSVQRDSRQWLTREKLVKFLHKNGIRTLEAQGTVTKLLYPSTELRMMSDIDFIIDAENLEKAEELMSGLGYDIDTLIPGEFNAQSPGKEQIEFHTDFFTEYMFNRKERYSSAVSAPFEHAVPSDEDPLSFRLNDTYFYLYSVLHTIKHYETAGCGIRRILDLYFLKKEYENKTDTELINSIIDSNGFRESYEKLFALEAIWFENRESELDLSETVNDVVLSGNHGTSSVFVRNNVRKDEQEGIKFPRLKRIIDFIFPSREYICLGYPECRERGYSTAMCRLYRIYATLKKIRFSHTLRYIKSVLKSK